MLDWCQNLEPHEESNSQLTLVANYVAVLPKTTRNLIPPKFLGRANQHRLNSENRKGIKTHFSRSFKVDKETQTNLQEYPLKKLKDGFSQTVEIAIHPLGSKKDSLASSRHPSPTTKFEKNNVLKVENSITDRTNLLEVSKGTLDYKNQLNRQTKASSSMMESQEKPFIFEERSFHQVKNIESYHVSEAVKTKIQHKFDNFPAQAIMINHLPYRPTHQSDHRLAQSIRNTISEEESYTFSQKYKNMLRNVESEFKLSEKKHSQRKIRLTPEKRALFHDRETIVSKYGESLRDEKSMRVEESLVQDRDIRSFFTTLGKVESHDTFFMYLAIEKVSNLTICIKEISVYHIGNISQELLVYRQIEERRIRAEGILQLYQTQIDRDSYHFIKEPYTETLKEYIHAGNDPNNIESQVRMILRQMENNGFTLKMLPNLQDFVVCLGIVKIHNLGIFQFDNQKKIEIDFALRGLKEQIIEQLS